MRCCLASDNHHARILTTTLGQRRTSLGAVRYLGYHECVRIAGWAISCHQPSQHFSTHIPLPLSVNWIIIYSGHATIERENDKVNSLAGTNLVVSSKCALYLATYN
jgi:hypothetical protein